MFIDEILALKTHSGEWLIKLEVKNIHVSYLKLEASGETVGLGLENQLMSSTGTGRTTTRTRWYSELSDCYLLVSSEQCENLQGSDGEREGEAGQGEDRSATAGEKTRPGPGTKCRDAGPVQRFGETQCWNIMRYNTSKCAFPSHNIRFKGILKFVSAAANSKVFDVQNVPRQ